MGIFGDTDKARYAVPNKLITLQWRALLNYEFSWLARIFNPETDLWTCEPSPKSIAETILTITGGVAYPVDWKQTRQKY